MVREMVNTLSSLVLLIQYDVRSTRMVDNASAPLRRIPIDRVDHTLLSNIVDHTLLSGRYVSCDYLYCTSQRFSTRNSQSFSSCHPFPGFAAV